jgi:uncharacterized alpha-E superfamily protein
MLGRSANNIFWMARYLERAENTARLLDVGFRLALTRGADAARAEWRSVLVTIGQEQDFARNHSDFTPTQVFNFILRDRDNPSSVLNMIENARTSARAVRTGITREVWEATNECWMEVRELLARPVREAGLGQVLAAIRSSTTQVRGAMDGTMLRHEIHNFARIGTFVERADNTARILDVKYWVLLPSVAWVGSQLDNAQWETVLRSVGGERAFRWLNAGTMDPRGIAEFLILDGRFPRSLKFCYDKIGSNMAGLARQYGCEMPSHGLVGGIAAQFEEMGTDAIFDSGLHEFIVAFLDANNRVGEAIAADYRFIE